VLLAGHPSRGERSNHQQCRNDYCGSAWRVHCLSAFAGQACPMLTSYSRRYVTRNDVWSLTHLRLPRMRELIPRRELAGVEQALDARSDQMRLGD